MWSGSTNQRPCTIWTDELYLKCPLNGWLIEGTTCTVSNIYKSNDWLYLLVMWSGSTNQRPCTIWTDELYLKCPLNGWLIERTTCTVSNIY